MYYVAFKKKYYVAFGEHLKKINHKTKTLSLKKFIFGIKMAGLNLF